MKKNKVIKAGIWYTICNFIVKGLTVLTMPIFTRIMTSSDVGLFSNISSWVSLLAIIATFEIYSSISIARFDFRDEIDNYISSTLILGTLITSIFYVFALIFHSFVENLLMIDFFTLNIIFIYLLFYPAMQMFQMKNQIKYNYKPIIIVSLSSSFASTIFSIFLTLFLIKGLKGRIIGYFVPFIIINFIIYFYLLKKGGKITKKYWKYALVISFPLIWHLLAGYILSSSDKIMITKLISAEANGLYSVPYTLSMVVSLLWTSMNNAWAPWAYEQMDKKNYKNLYNYSKPYTILFLIIVFCFMLITPEMLLVFGGKYYLKSIYVIPPVMVGYIFQFIYSLYVNIEFYHKKQAYIAIGTIIAAIINIILNFALLPKFGYVAAAYTTLIGYFILLLIHYLFVRKLKKEKCYDIKFFVFVIILSTISIFIMNLLYICNLIRYLIILLMFIFVSIYLILHKCDIIQVVKEKSIEKFIKIFWKRSL